MPAIYQYTLTVSDDAIDEQGHVSNVEFIRWMQSAAVAHSTAQGWSTQRYRESGAGWVVRSHQITYLQPAYTGDSISVLTWVSNFRKIRSLRKYKIMRSDDQTILALAETDWAFIGREHHAPRRIPQELAAAFVIVADQDEP